MHDEHIVTILAFAGGTIIVALQRYLGDLLRGGIDWFMRNVIIKSERRLAIWVHHKLAHPSRNSLTCEIGDCRKVVPTKTQ